MLWLCFFFVIYFLIMKTLTPFSDPKSMRFKCTSPKITARILSEGRAVPMNPSISSWEKEILEATETQLFAMATLRAPIAALIRSIVTCIRKKEGAFSHSSPVKVGMKDASTGVLDEAGGGG